MLLTALALPSQAFSRYNRLDKSNRSSSSRKQSSQKDHEPTPPKEAYQKSRARDAVSSSAKRRTTMNSRIAWDEEEALRKALEESKSNGSSMAIESGSRKGKRVRDSSDESVPTRSRTSHARSRPPLTSATSSEEHNAKRRRTETASVSPDAGGASAGNDSEPENAKTRSKASSGRKAQEAATRTQQVAERLRREKEKEQRDQVRADAAGKRKGRADRRRGDGECSFSLVYAISS